MPFSGVRTHQSRVLEAQDADFWSLETFKLSEMSPLVKVFSSHLIELRFYSIE